LRLELAEEAPSAQGSVTIRLTLLNDSYQPATVDRRLLIGPHPVGSGVSLVSREPAFAEERQNILILNPWCFYGRQRTFAHLPSGTIRFHAYLLKQGEDSLGPEGPQNPAAMFTAAEPLSVTLP
jgi:hypothetical protein